MKGKTIFFSLIKFAITFVVFCCSLNMQTIKKSFLLSQNVNHKCKYKLV